MIEITSQKIGNLLVLKPQITEVKTSACPDFKACLLDACNNSHDILLDLSQIKALDSGGLSALMYVGLSIKAQNGRKFALCSLTKPVSSILSLTHIDQLFSVFENPKVAIDSLTLDVKEKGSILFLGEETLLHRLQNLSDTLLFETKENPDTHYKFILVEEKFVNQLHKNKNIDEATLLILTQKGNASKYSGIRTLELPLSEEEILALAKALKEGISNNKSSTKLSEKYQATLLEKIDKLKQLIESNSFKELKDAVHKLAGSAGTYGYVKAGNVCKEMELLLESPTKPSIQELEVLLKKIKFHFNTNFYSDNSSKAKPFMHTAKTAVCVLSKDENFLSVIKQATQNFELELQETDQNVAYDIVIFDDIQEIEKIKDEFLKRNSKVKLWLAFEGNNLEDHIRATEAGVDLLITKPFTVKSIENIFKQNLKESTYKVLVVDDDPDITHFIHEALKEWGIEVETLADGTKILEKLHQFKPHLLLLDIQLPNYDGWALLNTLRNDERYKNLKIVFITALDKNAVMKKGDYDEIWFKPLDKATLQKKVYQLAKGQASEEKLSEVSFTHFLPENTFKNLLQTILNSQKKLATLENALIIIGSLDFENLSPGEQNDFLIFSENLIHRLLPPDALYGYLGKGHFALFYTAYSPALDDTIHRFLNESEYKYILPRTANGERLYSTYSILLIHCTQLPESASAFLAFARKAYETSIAFPSQFFTLDFHQH